MNGTPSEPTKYIDSQGRLWKKISQFSRHPDHPDDGIYGHPNQYWVCPECTFHLCAPGKELDELDTHDCFIEKVVKPVMLS